MRMGKDKYQAEVNLQCCKANAIGKINSFSRIMGGKNNFLEIQSFIYVIWTRVLISEEFFLL